MAEGKALHVRDFENMDADKILTQVTSDFKDAEANQEQHFTLFKELYKLYRTYTDDSSKVEGRSNLFIPYTFHVIETVTPKLVLSIFNTRPYIQTIPLGVDNESRVLRSKKMNKLLDYQFERKIKLIPTMTETLKACAIYGTAITKQTWNFKTRKAVKREQTSVLGGLVKTGFKDKLVETVTNDDPAIQLINILDFFYDPAGTNIEDCRYVIHRYYEDYHELVKKNQQSGGKAYTNLDKLKSSDKASTSSKSNKMINEVGYSSTSNSTKGIEIWEYWTDEWVVKVANQDTIIYSQMNPYYHMKKPFAKWTYTAIPNEFYGMGAIEPIKSLQYELNTTRNQRIDNVAFVLNKMWKVLRGANIDPEQLISRPAGFIEVDELTDVQEITFTDVTASAYKEETVIKNDIDIATGVHDTERGSAPSRRETATTMNILSQAGIERFKLSTTLIEYGGLHEAVNQIVALNQQYIDRSKEIIILGDNNEFISEEITPEDVLGEWDIVAIGSSLEPSINREVRQTQLVQLYNIIQNRPDINHVPLLKNIFEAFDIKNINEIFQANQQVPNQDMFSPNMQMAEQQMSQEVPYG